MLRGLVDMFVYQLQFILSRYVKKVWYVLFAFASAAVRVPINGVDWPNVSAEANGLVRLHGTNELGVRQEHTVVRLR